MRERVARCSRSDWLEHRVRSRFVDRVEKLILGAGASGTREGDGEDAAADCARRQHAAGVRRQLLEATLHETGDRRRQLDVATRAQFPATGVELNQLVVEQRAENLRREEVG